MKIFEFIINLFRKIKQKREFNKRLKELKKRDPFRYDH